METKNMTNDEQALYGVLKILFSIPCLILMLGDWRTGKTDASLLLGHLGLEWGLLDRIGSNIFTFNNPRVDYINSQGRLRRWLHMDRTTKLFVFDEALQHLPSRRAMSKKNVDLMGLVTELSKAHGRMIFCAQSDKVDSQLLDSAFLRAVFKKHSKKVMTVSSKLFERLTFTGLPRSPIKFDKDRLAEFWQSEAIQHKDLSEAWKVGEARIQHKSYSWIRDNLGIHPETAKRHVAKLLKTLKDREQITVVNNPN